MYRAPKSIINHPAVEECLDARAENFYPAKHDIFLKEGWVFENGRNEGGRCFACETVADFKYANPIRKE